VYLGSEVSDNNPWGFFKTIQGAKASFTAFIRANAFELGTERLPFNGQDRFAIHEFKTVFTKSVA
jgi:hypothetical protein